MARENIPVGRFYASYPSDCTYQLNSSLILMLCSFCDASALAETGSAKVGIQQGLFAARAWGWISVGGAREGRRAEQQAADEAQGGVTSGMVVQMTR